jgi:putative FmdB family regulatory protein
MPIYEYQCIKCAALTEEFEKVSAMQKVIPCSVCGAPADKITSLTQKFQPHTGAMRQEEKIERTTEVKLNLNTRTGDRKVYERPLKIEKD